MNAKRNNFVFLLVLLLCLTFPACGNNPIESTDRLTNPTDRIDSTFDKQSGTVDMQTLRSGNWAFIGTDFGLTHLRHTEGEGGYYYLTKGGYLQFLDPSNGISVTLCQKAGCLHENGKNYNEKKACEARLDMHDIFYYDNGYIYYDKIDSHGQHLYRRWADGTGEEYIATLWKDHADNNHTIQLGSYLATDGILYYTISASSAVQDEDGVFIVTEVYRALLRLDLSSGKEEEILCINDAGINLFAAKKDAVLYSTMDTKYYEVPNGPNRLEAMYNTLNHVMLWTKEANISQEVLCKPYRFFPGVDGFESGKIISWDIDTNVYYSYDLITAEYQELNNPGGIALFEDYYYVNNTVYNTASMEEYPNKFLELSGTGYTEVWITFFGRSKGGLLMQRQYFGPDKNGSIIGKEIIYSYVPFISLTDGLQIEDVKDFYAE